MQRIAPGALWLPRFASARPGWLDLAALRAPGRPGWLDLAALCAPGRIAGSIWLLKKRGPVQRNVDFTAQGQCFVDVALVASIWLLCALLDALAASIWLPCALLGVLAASIGVPCALLGALTGSIWLLCAFLGALTGSICVLCALLGVLADSIWLLWALLVALAASIWLQTIAPTLSLSTVCLDAACLVRSGTSPHASNLVYIYIYSEIARPLPMR